MIAVRVPASTANLGPGFDALGMALAVHAELGIIDDSTADADRAKAIDEHHPATVAYQRAGGTGALWVRSPIPIGRGMGFSGAMRVGGAALAVVERVGGDGFDSCGGEVLAVAAGLEGHADNAAASLRGGIVATDGRRMVRLDTPLEPDVVVWIPDTTTSTSTSRGTLPERVSFADAVFNIGNTAVLVAALATGDVAVLREATADRLHQERRFEHAPGSRAALAAGLAAGAWCGWLSGSGPSIAILIESGAGKRLADALPSDGHTKVVAIDRVGTVVVDGL